MLTFTFGITIHKAIAQQADTTKNKEAIKQLVTNYENAWNRHDSKSLADNYDTNATWVNWFGAYYIGKKDIQNHYETVHTTYFKTSHYYTRAIEDIVFVKPDVAISTSALVLQGMHVIPDKRLSFAERLY